MRIITEPMLAPSKPLTDQELATLQFPMAGSYKKDGMRIVTLPQEGALTRSFKQLPNSMLRMIFKQIIPPYLDGELLCGDMTFRDTMSKATSHGGTPKWEYHVFDCFKNPNDPFRDRYREAIDIVAALRKKGMTEVNLVAQTSLTSLDDLMEFEEFSVSEAKEEGIMVRSWHAPYKCGRSTIREQGLLKVKRFDTSEAVVVGFEEMMENRNPATVSPTGKTVRSTRSEGMVHTGMLGSFVCKSPDYKLTFNVGGGMTELQRCNFWQNRNIFLGMTLNFKHTPHDTKDRPKSAVFRGFRDTIDLS